MHSMHHLNPNPQRPMGPRTQRSASPSPFHPGLQDVQPLNVRKASSLNLREAAQTDGEQSNGPSSSTSSLLSRPTLQLPMLSSPGPPSRPGGRPKLSLQQVKGEAFVGGYAGGPNNQNGSISSPQINTNGSNQLTITSAESEPTIRPQVTIVSPQNRPAVVSMDNLRQTVEEFDKWSDDMLEEISRLGEGAGGAVYKVRDKRTGVIMARKTITTLEAPMKQLIRELKIISSTSHVNIVHFYGAFISPSSSEVSVLMEFCEGGSLESVGKRMRQIGARVGEKVAGHLAEGILQGLNYLHSQKTIHRDIKPPNVLLTREGVVRLCDFGVSGELVNSNAGTFTGTSLYMAPERLSGLQYNIRSDVWSTGITLLELITNRFPFPNDLAQIELMMYITQNEPPELEDEEDIVYSPEMKAFIKSALTRDPAARPTPKDLLSHPWIVEVMQKEVNTALWLRKVWGWRTRKSESSRPGSSRGDSLEASMASLRVNNDSPPSGES